MTDANSVKGRGRRFQDGREVALFDLGDSFGMRFTQSDKSETRLRLTKESMRALVRLYIEEVEAVHPTHWMPLPKPPEGCA